MSEHCGNRLASLTSTALLQLHNLMSLPLNYELRDSESTNLLASDAIESGEALELLIPDSRKLEITVDGYTCDIEMKG